ncbi:urease accessory protein UreF [Usitatibacter palustris]|uniref:Urease accessory protein UreF n=1 Tax=Usitatibacter palustris TaxID=2732487 RepID=A0A6M4H7U3_9PROT|nr:urease accessory UreF family protein [Usitatibacter palustris]QJR15442.1 Urease accessory protein UreF [Usitatibacter palustris]
MAKAAALPLARLLQLASPALPVGAYSYSQGLESAVEAGVVHDRASAQQWINDVAALSLARWELPLLAKLIAAWQGGPDAAMINARFLASRESAELRAETVQMGYSLARLAAQLEIPRHEELEAIEEPVFPTAFAFFVAAWKLPVREALSAYLWSWMENAVMAAVKCVPLGQTDAQRALLDLGDHIDTLVTEALDLDEDAMAPSLPRMALLSARHETQYSRLFRS